MDIPDEILFKIFLYIDFRKINNIKLCCKRFNKIIDDLWWKKKCEIDNFDINMGYGNGYDLYLFLLSSDDVYYGSEKYKSYDICGERSIIKNNLNMLSYFCSKNKGKNMRITSLEAGLSNDIEYLNILIENDNVDWDYFLNGAIENNNDIFINKALENHDKFKSAEISTYTAFLNGNTYKYKILELFKEFNQAANGMLYNYKMYDDICIKKFIEDNKENIDYRDIFVNSYISNRNIIMDIIPSVNKYHYRELLRMSIIKDNYELFKKCYNLGIRLNPNDLINTLACCTDIRIINELSCNFNPNILVQINSVNGFLNEAISAGEKSSDIYLKKSIELAKENGHYDVQINLEKILKKRNY